MANGTIFIGGQPTGSGGGGFNPAGSNSQTGPFFTVDAGVTPTANGAGYRIGTSDTNGLAWVYHSAGVFAAYRGDLTTFAAIEADNFQTSRTDGVTTFGLPGGSAGMGVSSTGVSFVAGGVTGLLMNASQQFTGLKHLPVAANTSVTLTTTQFYNIFNVNSASAVTLTLPAATGSGGCYTVFQLGAGGIVLKPAGTDTIRIGATVSTATTGNQTSSTVGASLSFIDNGTGTWIADSVIGTWTAA